MIVLAALRLNSFRETGLSIDPTFAETEFLCWTAAELNYSIISATLPILRPLISNLATHYGGGFGQSDGRTYADGSTGSYMRSRTHGLGDESIQLQSLERSKAGHVGHQVTIQRSQGDGMHERGTNRAYTSARRRSQIGESSNEDAASVESSDSKRMIIRKDITWVVDHDRQNM